MSTKHLLGALSYRLISVCLATGTRAIITAAAAKYKQQGKTFANIASTTHSADTIFLTAAAAQNHDPDEAIAIATTTATKKVHKCTSLLVSR